MSQIVKDFIPPEGCPEITEIKDEDIIEIFDDDPFTIQEVQELGQVEELSEKPITDSRSLENQLNSFLSFIHRDLRSTKIPDDNKTSKEITTKKQTEINSNDPDDGTALNLFLSHLREGLNCDAVDEKPQKVSESIVKDEVITEKLAKVRKRKVEPTKEPDNLLAQEVNFKTSIPIKSDKSTTWDNDDDDFHWNEDISSSPSKDEEEIIQLDEVPPFIDDITCRFCTKKFPTGLQRHYHEKNIHPKSKVVCEICGEILNSRRLKVHKKKHMIERRFKCDKCPKSFKDNYDLKRHTSDTHDNSTDCFCDHCGKKLSCKKSLRKHLIQYHMSYLALKCPECNKPFGDKARLTRHLSVHKRERGEFIEQVKNEECNICNKKFATSTHLKQHMGKHNQKREFQCRYCPSAFNFFSSCRNHEKNVHNSNKVKRRKPKKLVEPKPAEPVVVLENVREDVTIVTALPVEDSVMQEHSQQVIEAPQQGITIFPQNILIAIPDTDYYAIAPLYCN